jgi:phosphate transport system permease protein
MRSTLRILAAVLADRTTVAGGKMEQRIDVAGQRAGSATIQKDVARHLQKRTRVGEHIIEALLFLCGMVSILTTIGIVLVLTNEALLFFSDERVTLTDFFTKTLWQPSIGQFGILPLVNATLMSSAIAMLVALPIGLSAAIYLSEYASPRMRGILKPILEVLAGVPTVVYGFFALTFMTPILQRIFGRDIVDFQNVASAGIVMGIMIIPIISSMSEDALSAVPRSLREGAYGLGATRLEVATRIVLPAALSGIVAAFIVGISRAIGETMIVAVAAGGRPFFTFNPFKAAETMTGHIARISGGDISYGSIDYTSVYAIGLTLFAITLALNILSQRIVRRFREVYE